MVKFCRSCGEELSNSGDKTCSSCNANAVKSTSFCRYCGKPTKADDLVCANCGAAVKPTPNSIRLLNPDHIKLMRLGKVINLSIVVVVVVAYIVFTLPKSVTKPIAQASSDVMQASTGYTSLPLNSISITPPLIPELVTYGMVYVPPGITVNATRPLTVYAVYKNSNTENATKAIRLETITQNCTYQSGNEKIAKVDQNGLVRATGPGTTNITVSYTVAPGSANMSTASAGKIPVTFTAKVQIFVK